MPDALPCEMAEEVEAPSPESIAFALLCPVHSPVLCCARYPDDSYDRYWHPSGEIDGTVTVARDNMNFIKNFTNIPGLALAHAITPASSNATTLTVPSSETDLEDDTYYYTFYFSEVLEAAYQNESRSFDFLLDGEKLNDYGPIIPPYQSSVLSHYNHDGRRLTAGSNISLVNTPDASLPPILNAMELFKLKTGLADGTSRNDPPPFLYPISSKAGGAQQRKADQMFLD
ncbi:hypothetical protein EJ110_NYTH47774 [Nymphaea thermarum]|nr:hypothetical protein EJ110_NYTH47774 [Nymphaea thermarum]